MTRARWALDGLDDDIRDHIERETQENIDRGLTPEEARRQAHVKFGNVTLAREDTRAVWGWQRLEQLAQDIWYAVRVLRRRPAYALLSVLTLALGVGGTASVYSVARGVLFDPLPYAHEREVGVFWKKTDWTQEEYLHIRGRVPGFSEVALYRRRDAILRDGDASSAPRRRRDRVRRAVRRARCASCSRARVPRAATTCRRRAGRGPELRPVAGAGRRAVHRSADA